MKISAGEPGQDLTWSWIPLTWWKLVTSGALRPESHVSPCFGAEDAHLETIIHPSRVITVGGITIAVIEHKDAEFTPPIGFHVGLIGNAAEILPEIWKLVRKEVETAFGRPAAVLSTHGRGFVQEALVYQCGPTPPMFPPPGTDLPPQPRAKLSFWRKVLLVLLFAYLWNLLLG
jgi:hypothetical protein